MLPFAIAFLTAKFPLSAEFQALTMALQGVMKVRNEVNKSQKMNWFHAFMQGVLVSYSGGIFAPLWMGRPCAMLSNDLNMASCIIAYVLVNCIPFNMGYKVAGLFPVRLVTTMGAQLFRSMGVFTFVNIAYQHFKESPSAYYPTPIFGPILFGTILGNMGCFITLGIQGHLQGGMSLPFQNGLFVSSLYHFLVNDKDGQIGVMLRNILKPFTVGFSNEEFAMVICSLFMQSWAILQMPEFFGPSFNPFNILQGVGSKAPKTVPKKEVAIESSSQGNESKSVKKKKNNRKKKKKQS